MLKPVYRLLIELTNGRWTSGILQKFAQSSLSRRVIPSFSRIYNINESEMEKKLHEYPTLHEFFIRKLKEGVRVTDESPDSAVSPVDAVIEDIGDIREDRIITVKGKDYSISEMLGANKAGKYAGGTYMIFYLSPSHYHRIHSPVTGKVADQWILGLKSFPVNKWGLKYGRETLSKNFRSITEVKHGDSAIAIVKVGAMFVNSIELTHEGDQLEKGKEMAYFTFGSTVILLFEKGKFQLEKSIKTPAHIKVGERIGTLL
ncbi:phosphatidylserine decarboxylase [Cytobacillus firmus]|uniref:phosphatidylserine decarboxylase n=1 Tax=Cytobacillus firmus TaxID=1399 RepID=UPI0015812C5E|nr:phosphatidylserine decarboxylase [Cytobacillus firmus]MBG9549498.1 phosphatidylserine decarboxylase [Cytobacillus firmus]MBG9602624.1 phosphatidylserine decarboxylase [Cytobacillus firmus]MBG9654381.1 phosphatidylserine decarboxylase [Cytobacillus firmus]MDD9310901.1 phosphatidylserine decarboxylase [Cytobacillus firmus]MED1908192.1 phosphatidylserine decarboxylase [Cytobacillus firmus]